MLIPASAAEISEDVSRETSVVLSESETELETESESDSQLIQPFANIDPDYGIGTSYLDLFAGAVSKLPYGTHYVYYRESRYEYCLAYSEDLSLDGRVFTAPSATVITYDTQSSSYLGQATWTSSFEQSYYLDAGNYVVYSDLGMYPVLYDRGVVDYAQVTAVILCSFGVFYLLFRLRRAICQRFI